MSEEEKTPERAPRMHLSAERRDRFLEVLGQTGNRRFAAEAIGVEPRSMDQRRGSTKCATDSQWEAALAQAHRRLSGADGPFDCIGGRDLNVIRKGEGGRLMIVASGPKRWNRTVEDRFFAALRMCGNVAASARAVGFGESCVWQRRAKWPAFAAAMDQVLDEAEVRLEFRIASMGSEVWRRQREWGQHTFPHGGDKSGEGLGKSDCPLSSPSLRSRFRDAVPEMARGEKARRRPAGAGAGAGADRRGARADRPWSRGDQAAPGAGRLKWGHKGVCPHLDRA